MNCALSLARAADGGVLLWQIGKPDNDNREFALAPKGYAQFHDDGFFVVGKSDPKRDWPYVHPGPHDAWAGSRSHTFSVFFGLKSAEASGECRLRVDLLDTHRTAPPELRVSVNGQEFRQKLPGGAGDASIFGEPAKGREYTFNLTFPASLLRAGANEITLSTRSGSWVLYDWLGLETPVGLELAEVSGTVVGSMESPPVLVERQGRLRQIIRVGLRHFGEPTQARVRVEGASDLAVTLNPGPTNVEIAVPTVETSREVSVTVEAAGRTLATRALTLKPVRPWVVYLLPHSHVDIGYTHIQTDVEKAQWQYLEMALATARQTAGYPPGCRFKWNVEVLWAVDGYLRQATPEKRRAFFEAVQAGQVGLDALYGNMLTGLCSPEELFRVTALARRLGQESGVPVVSAMITDVPGYTWGMVPVLAHSGVKYFSIGPNGGDRIGHTAAAWGDKPFWWLGPNPQDKVLVWMTGTGYYRVFSSGANLLQYLARLEDKGYPYDLVQVRHCLGDNGAPDVNFADTVKQWNATYAYPKLVIATTAEMFRDFEQRYGDKIPTARGDFTPYWEDGAASSALETAMNRATADRLVQAETLFALFNPKAYPAEDFDRAWRNVILYNEHTWGAHNSVSQPDDPFVKSQWAIKRQFALDADAQSRRLLEAANAARGTAAPPGLTSDSTHRAAGRAFDVVNTTGARLVHTLVTVPRVLAATGQAVADLAGSPVGAVCQRLTTGELVFRPSLEPFQARRYLLTEPPSATTIASFPAATAQGLTLSVAQSPVARGLTLRLDEKTGGMASLIYDGRELVDTNAPTALNDYFYLPGSDLKKLQRNGPVKISVKEQGPLIASLVVESDAPGCHKLTREYRLHALRNYVEIINTVDKKAVRAKEGVHFGFGFQVPGATVRLDVPWAVVRPEADQIPGACKNWFTVQRWVDLSNDDYGVTWLTPDAPLVQIGGITANLIGSLPDPRAWMDKIEPSTTLYSWAMNNHWHTNYRAEQEGPTVFRYFIIPHGRQEPDRPARLAAELCQPALVLPPRGDPQPLPPLAGVTGAHLVTFKPSEDGQARILRLFNATSAPSKTSLAWNAPDPKAVWLSDASERPLRPVHEPLEMPAWGLVTLRAEWP